jgi:ABC-type Fe3+ transport system substrate-binding protein
MKFRGLSVGLSVAAILFVSFTAAWSQKLDSIVEGAKKEGALRLGLSLRWQIAGRPQGKKLVDSFQQRYPFIKKITYDRVGGTRERQKVLTEISAGQISYDVTVFSDSQVPSSLQTNVVEMVDWKSLGIKPSQIGIHDVGLHIEYGIFGIAYNRKLVSDAVGEQLTWDDCVNPKWKGKNIMNDTPGHLVIFYQPSIWGKQKTLAHARRLSANGTIWDRSSSDSMKKVGLGEYPLNCGGLLHNYLELVQYENNKDIGYVAPDPVPVTNRGIYYIPRKVANPNAARLFLIWVVSEEGQRAMDQARFSGDPTIPGTTVGKFIKGRDVVRMAPEWKVKESDITKEIVEAMGLPIVR